MQKIITVMHMITTIVRTAILYIFVIVGLRIMGKRQIGDMQPGELVVTILISEIAAIPIQDITQPVLGGIVAIFTLVCLEILITVITMKSTHVSQILNGKSAMLIKDGIIDQKLLKRLRITNNDLVEVLRLKDIFSVEDVAYAILETNGKLSVMMKKQKAPVTAKQMSIETGSDAMQTLVISDGVVFDKGLSDVGSSATHLDAILHSHRMTRDEIFLMTLDKDGHTVIIKKE